MGASDEEGSGEQGKDKEGKGNVSGLIPEIYYDLIARVAAGVPLILIFVVQNYPILEKTKISVTDWTFYIIVLGLGYLVGHLLTTISIGLNAIIWRPILVRWIRNMVPIEYHFKSTHPREIMNELYHRIDWVAHKDRSGGVVRAGPGILHRAISGISA